MSPRSLDSKWALPKPAGEKEKMARFFISGGIGTGLFYVFNEWLYAGMEGMFGDHRSAVAWTISYAVSIVWQHALHRSLVFGGEGAYWKTLMWTYASYGLSLVLSGVLNDVLTVYLMVGNRPAWFLTLGGTGIINFFTVRAAFELNPTKVDKKE